MTETVSWAQSVIDAPQGRAKTPDSREERKALQQIAEVYDEKLRFINTDKKPESLVALADQLFDDAHNKDNELAVRYVCIIESRKLMERAGNASGALRSIDYLNELFDVNPLPLKVNSLLAATPRTKSDYVALAELLLEIADELERVRDFNQLPKVAEAAVTAAKNGEDAKLLEQAFTRRQSVPILKEEYLMYEQANATLIVRRNDPEANLVAGRYECLVDGDWQEGGPKLAKASDPVLQKIAQREIAKPQTLKEILQLAEAWKEASATQTGTFKERMLRESAYWYLIGSFQATGIQKTFCEKMASQDSRVTPRKPSFPGLLQTIYDGPDFNKLLQVEITPQLDNNYGYGGPAPGLPADNFSVRWEGWLRVPETNAWSIMFLHDDGGRLWIDDVKIFDQWGSAETRSHDINLTAGLHRLKVEYCERGGTAGAAIAWKLKGAEGQPRPIQPEAFFCDPNQVRASRPAKQ